jgi:hypothetical protein
MVCPEDWEPRQTQDYVRGKAEKQIPYWTRSEPADTMILNCSTRTSLAGYAIAGCAIAGNTVDPGPTLPSTFTI